MGAEDMAKLELYVLLEVAEDASEDGREVERRVVAAASVTPPAVTPPSPPPSMVVVVAPSVVQVGSSVAAGVV